MLPFRLLEEFLHWRLPISSSLDETPQHSLDRTPQHCSRDSGISRTQKTKGQQQWEQGGVPWNTEDPAAEAEGVGAVLSSGTERPGEHPLTSLDRTSQH